MAMPRRRLRAGPRAATSLLALALLTVLVARPGLGNSATSALKSRQSNPVLPAIVEGKRVNLILTTDMDGIMICQDRAVSLSPSSKQIDFDYARKLLRYQLSGMVQFFVPTAFAIPSLGVETVRRRVGVFYLSQQTLGRAALAYFLHDADADGFIGVGFAFRLSSSPFWNLANRTLQYRYALRDNTSQAADAQLENSDGDDAGDLPTVRVAELSTSDFIAGRDDSEQTEWDWSEPCASVDQADDAGRTNNQGLSFPIHHARFQCTQEAESAEVPLSVRDVAMFGDFTSNWDVVVDFNAPCLLLPQQFYNSLAGWTGLMYNEDAKISEIAVDTPLPPLFFSLTHDGPTHSVDLNRLVFNSTGDLTNATKRVCIQQSTSIVHNGASVFSPIDTESTAQRYRLHGTMMLPVYNMLQAPIVFGFMALRAMDEMVVDGEAKQLAFPYPPAAQSSKKSAASTLPMCRSSPQCRGLQEFSPRLNACLDPDCGSYYFQSLDPHSKTCAIDVDWLTFLYTTIAVFVAAELLLAARISRTVKQAIETVTAT